MTNRKPKSYDDLAASLWEETQEDWHLTFSVTLTEPVCPFIDIHPDEGSEYPALQGYICKTAAPEQAIFEAIQYHLENIATFKREKASRSPQDMKHD